MNKILIILLTAVSFSASALPKQKGNLVRGKKAEDLFQAMAKAKIGGCQLPSDCTREAKNLTCAMVKASKVTTCSLVGKGGGSREIGGEQATKLFAALGAAGGESNLAEGQKILGPSSIKCTTSLPKAKKVVKTIYKCWVSSESAPLPPRTED